MSDRRRLQVVLCVTLVASTRAHAQTAAVDLGVGAGQGYEGGFYNARSGVAASVSIINRMHPGSIGAFVVGAVGGVQTVIHFADDCLLTPSGGCAPNYPSMQVVSAVGGWEAGGGPGRPSVRAMVGPSIVHSSTNGTTVGGQTRVDVSTPPLVRVALILWRHDVIAPRLQGARYRLSSWGVGLRVR